MLYCNCLRQCAPHVSPIVGLMAKIIYTCFFRTLKIKLRLKSRHNYFTGIRVCSVQNKSAARIFFISLAYNVRGENISPILLQVFIINHTFSIEELKTEPLRTPESYSSIYIFYKTLTSCNIDYSRINPIFNSFFSLMYFRSYSEKHHIFLEFCYILFKENKSFKKIISAKYYFYAFSLFFVFSRLKCNNICKVKIHRELN